jgi:hypothetical protein
MTMLTIFSEHDQHAIDEVDQPHVTAAKNLIRLLEDQDRRGQWKDRNDTRNDFTPSLFS